MFLAIRMVLYFVFAWLAGQGIGVWDEVAGSLTLTVDHIIPALIGFGGYVGTFVVSRFAVKR